MTWSSANSRGAGEADVDLDQIISILQATLRFATPICLGALAGIYCERAGVVNIAIEGLMLTSACTGFLGLLYANEVTGSPGLALLVGTLVGLLTGLLLALLHGVVSIRFKTDQIISGTVINILAVGATGYIYRAYLATNAPVSPGVYPFLSDMPIIGPIFAALEKIPFIGPILFHHHPIAFGMLLLVLLTHYVLFHTAWGLRTRAVGEHPRAADTAGINVNRMRYADVLVASLIAGLGGIWFTLETVGVFNPNMTVGIGFIGLAAMIFGKWHPLGALAACWLFGFLDAVSIRLQGAELPVPYQFLSMIPYLLTIIVLAGAVGRARPPAAEGKPYEHA